MSVAQEAAAWLKSANDNVTTTDAAVKTAWGSLAAASEIVSPFAMRSAAVTEAARQLLFFGKPLAIDKMIVNGLRADLLGRRIIATADRGGLAGTRCIVLGVEEQADVELTVLTLLRRLA